MKKLYLIICVICLTLIMSDIAKATILVVWQADPNGSGVVNNIISRVKLTPDKNNVMVFHYNGDDYGIPTRVDKLDASTGEHIWVPYREVNKPGEKISLNGWVDSSGNLYIMPSWSGNTIWKYDSELATELCSYTTYDSGFEYVTDAMTDEFDNIYVSGFTGSGSNQGSRLVKLDNNCNETWTFLSKNTSSKDDYGHAIALDSSKNVFRVGADSGAGVSDRGRLIGHSASNGAEFLNYTVNETNSHISGITIDSSDYIYIAYCYDYTLSGQERTVVQKLERNGSTATVVWEYRFEDIGMNLGRDVIVKHTGNSFYVAFNLWQGGTTVPGIAEFDLNGNLLWKETIDRPGWNFSSIDAKDNYIYVGLNKADVGNQTQVLCLQILSLLSPNGGEKWVAGTEKTIEWYNYDPNINYVLIEYSANNGQTWNDIDIWENTGSYEWYPIPVVDSNQCLVRISDLFNSNIYDKSDSAFTIFQCLNPIAGDLNGDCYVDFQDFAIIAEHWLNCGNPFDPACQS